MSRWGWMFRMEGREHNKKGTEIQPRNRYRFPLPFPIHETLLRKSWRRVPMFGVGNDGWPWILVRGFLICPRRFAGDTGILLKAPPSFFSPPLRRSISQRYAMAPRLSAPSLRFPSLRSDDRQYTNTYTTLHSTFTQVK